MKKRPRSAKLALVVAVVLAIGLVHSVCRDVLVAQTAPQSKVRQLPAGTIKGPIELADGESLQGAGCDKTIIDATGCQEGIIVKGGTGAVISDLTIKGAPGTALVVKDASQVVVKRVRVTSVFIGITFQGVKNGRIENCVADNNSFGLVVNGGADCVVVNNTVVDCKEIGLGMTASPGAVAFNNCIVGSGICLNIDKPANVHVDYNLYTGIYIAQMADQVPKKVLTGWHYVTAEDNKPGLDLHSVQMHVDFKDAKNGDFTPTNVLPWSLDRAVTSQWGVAEFAGAKAPGADMAGKARTARPGLGAVEAIVKAPRTADSEFTIAKDNGLKSAGVFTKDGMLISYLFQNQPLPAGKYAFWLPARDYVGQPIPAGNYDVRVAESDFKWKYLNHIGDNGADRYGPYTASANPKMVAFASKDILVMQQGESEDHISLRGYDIKTGKVLWYTYGCPAVQGMAVKDGLAYSLVSYNAAKKQSRLTRVNAATGEIVPWAGYETGHATPTLPPDVHSMAALGDYLYIADEKENKLHLLKIADASAVKTLDVPAPTGLASDEKANLLWVISGDSILALDPNGKQVASSKPVADPASLSACNGKLAIASHKTGKVHFFDASDPGKLKQTGELGKGDGPYGKADVDRFLFQTAPGFGRNPDMLMSSVAIDAEGQIAVTDACRRVTMFDKDRKVLWYTYGVFGNQAKPSFGTGNRRMYDPWVYTSFLLDEKAGTWQVEAVWDYSAMSSKGLNEQNIQLLGDFEESGKQYVVAIATACGRTPALQLEYTPLVMVGRLDGFKAVPVLTIGVENGQMVSRTDTNHDGKVDKADKAKPMIGFDGKPMPVRDLFGRFNEMTPDGSIVSMYLPAMIWKRTPGLDETGAPIYEGKDFVSAPTKDWNKIISPYDLKPEGLGGVCYGQLSDGGYVLQTIFRGSGGCGMNNGGGTDMIGVDGQGRRRWVNQMAQYHGIAGMGTADDITVTSIYYSMDVLPVDIDGLQLGGFCESPKLHYCGYWIDHPNLRFFKMPDGHLYFTNGDNAAGRHLWYRMENQDSYAKSKQPFTVSAERAAHLAAIQVPATPPAAHEVRPPSIRVPRFAKPMPIDGGIDKWRQAGIQPQIVMGPTGGKSAADASALIRMAYEGNNLYVQILAFDDIPVFGNFPVWQNSVEMAINGVWPNGMQYVAAKMADGKDVVWRNRFFSKVDQVYFPSSHAPCIVKVLDDAKGVPEREVLEHLYGEDLSKAKVIVTEFKIPMDKVTYAQAEADVPQLGPGKTFYVNFFVDDNDKAYNDVQQTVLIWPTGSSMFGAKEEVALATCE